MPALSISEVGGLRPHRPSRLSSSAALRTPPGRSPSFVRVAFCKTGDPPFPGGGPDRRNPRSLALA